MGQRLGQCLVCACLLAGPFGLAGSAEPAGPGISADSASPLGHDISAEGTGPFEEPVLRTGHEIRLERTRLRYVAETGRIAIRAAETGEPHGHMFYIAYRVPSKKTRPIAFIWNGGPGANSALLHFEAAGPRAWDRNPSAASPAEGSVTGATTPPRDETTSGTTLVPNSDTWLTDTDLVFVDPIGTGFSRPAKAGHADEFYGTIGDVSSVTEFIRAWRLLNGAEKAPLLLIGESWGAGRAGSVGYALEQRGIKVHALVLISGGTGLNDNPVPPALRQALRIPDLATSALHHRRLPEDLGDSAPAIRAEAEAWARGIYAPALERLDDLTDSERDVVISGLARFTGMPAEAIDRMSLLVEPRPYREGLLRTAGPQPGSVLQVFDMRLVTAAGSAGLGEQRAERAGAILRYLRQELGYRTSLPYVDLEPLEAAWAPGRRFPPSVNERWNYATAELSPQEVEAAIEEAIRHGAGPPQLGPPLPSAAQAVALNPELRVWVAAGRYDSLNSCTANEELGRRLQGILRDAYTFACYEGGHMMYRDAQARTELARHVRALAASVR